MKKCIWTVLLVTTCLGYGATAWSQESVNAGFGSVLTEHASVSYSIGQLFFSSGSDGTTLFHEGVIHEFAPKMPVGVEDDGGRGGLAVYPTFFADRVTIRLPYGVERGGMRVYDATGRMLLVTQLQSNSSGVDLSAFAQGMYWGVIECGGKNYTVRLIKR